MSILLSLFPPCHRYVPNQNSSVLFFPAYWGGGGFVSGDKLLERTVQQELERGFWSGRGWLAGRGAARRLVGRGGGGGGWQGAGSWEGLPFDVPSIIRAMLPGL